MLQIFSGSRPPTPKYSAETLQLSVYQLMHDAMVNFTNPPREHFFEQEIIRRHKIKSFQEPGKINDGLGLIWNEPYKWALIATRMGKTESDVKSTLSTIVARRNRIVHETDIDPLTGCKTVITQIEADAVSTFIQSCGSTIFNLVI